MPSPTTPPPRTMPQSARLMDSPYSDYYTDLSISPDTDPRDSHRFTVENGKLGYPVIPHTLQESSIDEISSSPIEPPANTPQRALLQRLRDIAICIHERENLTEEQTALLNSRVENIESDLTAPISQTKEAVLGDSGLFIDDEDDLEFEETDGSDEHGDGNGVGQFENSDSDVAPEDIKELGRRVSYSDKSLAATSHLSRSSKKAGLFFPARALEEQHELVARISRAATELRARYEEIKHLNDMNTLRLDTAATRIIDLQAENEALRKASELDHSELFYLKLQLRASDLQAAYRGLKISSHSTHAESIKPSEPDSLDHEIDLLREEMRIHPSQSPASSTRVRASDEGDDFLSGSQLSNAFAPTYRSPLRQPSVASDTSSMKRSNISTPTTSPTKRRRLLRIKRPSLQNRAVTAPAKSVVAHEISPIERPCELDGDAVSETVEEEREECEITEAQEIVTETVEEASEEVASQISEVEETIVETAEEASEEGSSQLSEVEEIIAEIVNEKWEEEGVEQTKETGEHGMSVTEVVEIHTVETTAEGNMEDDIVHEPSITVKTKSPWEELWDGLAELSGFSAEDY
ncbi:hypothetical protein P152DRAFT_462420 [Eremomyces bilateralis CBS 781.70]|uniref:Uncharacterized protein n=1 Tax=Eremomyces bilateralis CBS 781.70 TaxID=1392243 RepID=A0A6G1FRZ1_9PEZI|nr:uncharacterized protein P152DRAFT_462420 [Eremomyces bilateralis CBS 781.70]KAF1808554.1 hypothetical protein P152DRAFT_462420 [Eremomyces bilateralis CBS 781.70]